MKLLILDVDGVMTDGTKTYGPNGEVLSKRFCDHDWTAIKMFKKHGVTVCFLSADKVVNEAVAKDREVDFHYSRDDDGTIDKVKWLKIICEKYGIDTADTVYVGDDLFDLPIMRAVMAGGGEAYCPSNAVPQLREELNLARRYGENNKDHHRRGVLRSRGCEGAIMELFTLFFTDSTPPCH